MSVLLRELLATDVGLFSLIGLIILLLIPIGLAVFIWRRARQQGQDQP